MLENSLAAFPHTEKQLLELVAQGNEHAFTELFKQYAPLLRININKIIGNAYGASEVLQETFIKIWLNREKLASIDYARAYFTKIAVNECFDYLHNIARREQLHRQTNINSAAMVDPEENVSYKETAAIIQQAIEELPAQRKLIYQLSRNQGLNSTQIAKQLNLNNDYVRQAVSAACRHIKEKLLAAGKLVLLVLGII